MGVAVAENLAALVTEKSIPAPQAVLLCGDLYDYPDCHKRGGTGPVDDVYAAFSDFVPHVIGVHGNHDNLANGDSLPGNTVILDGQVHDASGLRIGGVSGIVGDPCRHQRRTSEDFLPVMERVTAQHPELLLLHQGPEDEQRLRRGDPDVTLSLGPGENNRRHRLIPADRKIRTFPGDSRRLLSRYYQVPERCAKTVLVVARGGMHRAPRPVMHGKYYSRARYLVTPYALHQSSVELP